MPEPNPEAIEARINLLGRSRERVEEAMRARRAEEPEPGPRRSPQRRINGHLLPATGRADLR